MMRTSQTRFPLASSGLWLTGSAALRLVRARFVVKRENRNWLALRKIHSRGNLARAEHRLEHRLPSDQLLIGRHKLLDFRISERQVPLGEPRGNYLFRVHISFLPSMPKQHSKTALDAAATSTH